MALQTDTRPRGPVTPEKYPVPVGTTYLYYGEQQGYIYNPYNDSYVPDPKLAQQYFQSAGLGGTPEGVPQGVTPGPKQPQKYPRTGPNYGQYGEVPGYVYDPYTDSYLPDPRAQQNYYESVGLAEGEPSMTDTYGPIVGTGLSLGLASGLAQNPTGFINGIKEGASGLFGLGSSAAPAATSAAAPAATTAAAASAPAAPSLIGASTGGGTFGLGGAGVAPATPEIASVAPASPGLFGIGGASPFLTAAGIGLGAHMGVQSFEGINKIIDNKELSPQEQISMAPWTFGASFAYNPIRDFFGGDGDKYKEEGNRLSELRDQGTFIPDEIFNTMPNHGRSKDELKNQSVADDFIGFDPSGNWTNNKFNESRDLKDLRPEDIVGYATWAERDPLWFEKPLQERLNVANAALQANAVKEHNGTIDVDFEKFDPGAAPASYSGYSGNPSLPTAPVVPAPAPASQGAPKPGQVPTNVRPYIPTPAPQSQPQPAPKKDQFWQFQQGAIRR